jgi:serine/threonine protein kinase
MAPESLKDGTFTTSSDVWSFGVVLWEMVTLAELPYKGYSNQEVIETVIKGKIIDRPEGCPDDLYDLMRECWQKRESRRPTFLDICERLLHIANDDFREKSFITPRLCASWRLTARPRPRRRRATRRARRRRA